jgi:hypothetical protein
MTDVPVTFIQMKCFDDDSIFIAASPDRDEPFSPFCRWFQYVGANEPESWSHHDSPWWAVTASTYCPPDTAGDGDWALIGMSQEGDVELSFAEDVRTEKILGAGVWSPDAGGWGYVSGLKQIGAHLYACGSGGQVYKRVCDNKWEHMDEGLIQAPKSDPKILLAKIDGISESEIYVVGSISAEGFPGRMYLWDGRSWRRVPLPTSERLTNLYVQDAETVWACGANGTLLRGNRHEGFRNVSQVTDNQLFYSITEFQGRIYLGSNLGPFYWDGSDIKPVQTNLSPPLRDASKVDSCKGVLWYVGEKDIACFDGSKWERIHHPDNPKIGE